MKTRQVDITISNSGSGFYGIHGETVRGRKWIREHVQGQHAGEAWTDDGRYARDIAEGAVADGLRVE
jgi:hypothetical protein